VVGQTISHYKIIDKLGEGGMGEVYRATDTKLKREVAIKVLPDRFTDDWCGPGSQRKIANVRKTQNCKPKESRP